MKCDSLIHKSQLNNTIMFAQMPSIRTFLVKALCKAFYKAEIPQYCQNSFNIRHFKEHEISVSSRRKRGVRV